jgi:hypothetical protein
MSPAMPNTPRKDETSFAKAPAKPTIADLKDQLRRVPGMSPNATCTILNDNEHHLLIVCGSIEPTADLDAVQDAADQILDAAGLNAAMRYFQDLRGTHLVIDATPNADPEA